jgi:hypothetical protein
LRVISSRKALGKLFPYLSGLIFGFQAFINWLLKLPSADNLIETIAAQLYLNDGFISLFYPGQNHGGMLEIPFQVLILKFVDNDFALATVPRIFFAFLTGFFLAKILDRFLLGKGRYWFIAALFLVPPLLKDGWLTGGGYSMSWALQLLTIYLVLISKNRFNFFLCGLLLSLAYYEQPSSLLLTAIFAPFVFSHKRVTKSEILPICAGFLPIFTLTWAFKRDEQNIVYDPFSLNIEFPRIFGSLGITERGSSNPSLLHNSLGFMNGPGMVTVSLSFIALLLISLSIYAVFNSKISHFERSLGLAVLLSCVGLGAISILVPTPAWFYGISLCIFIPFGVAVLIKTRPKSKFFIFPILIFNLFTVPSTFNTGLIGNLPGVISVTKEIRESLDKATLQMSKLDVDYIFGDYWDVYPIMASSSSDIIALPETFNRFKAYVKARPSNDVPARVVVENGKPSERLGSLGCKNISQLEISYVNKSWSLYSCGTEQIMELNQ